jgi:hypothetical protein
MSQTLNLSLFQLELIRETVTGFGNNKKMIHLPTLNGERIPVPLPLDILELLIDRFRQVEDSSPHPIQYIEGEAGEGKKEITLKWGDHERDSVQFLINEDEYSLE